MTTDGNMHWGINGTTEEDLSMCEWTLEELRQKAIKVGMEEKLFARDGLIAAGEWK